MKGVIFSTSFFILSISMFIGLSWFTNYDNYRSLLSQNFKKSIVQSANKLKELDDFDEKIAIEMFKEEIENSLAKNFEYDIKLLGFNQKPLLLRFKITAKSDNDLYKITLEETMIEKELDDEK